MSEVKREIHVDFVRHRETGLFLATSEELRGLYVHARTEAELIERIPQAIKAIVEAEHDTQVDVVPIEDAPGTGFAPISTRKAYQFSEAA